MLNKFWKGKHIENDPYWLTNSSLKIISKHHDINFSEYKNKKILDIGVGTGAFTKELQEYTSYIYAADISNVALQKVQPFSETYSTLDISQIPEVDLVICNLVFQHCEDEEVERIINDVNLNNCGIMSFQYAYQTKHITKFIDKYIELNKTHFFRSREKIRKIISNTDKKFISANILKFADFNWEIIKVENK